MISKSIIDRPSISVNDLLNRFKKIDETVNDITKQKAMAARREFEQTVKFIDSYITKLQNLEPIVKILFANNIYAYREIYHENEPVNFRSEGINHNVGYTLHGRSYYGFTGGGCAGCNVYIDMHTKEFVISNDSNSKVDRYTTDKFIQSNLFTDDNIIRRLKQILKKIPSHLTYIPVLAEELSDKLAAEYNISF